MNQPALNATEGATALDLNTAIEENKAKENQEQKKEPELENISIENATYLQSLGWLHRIHQNIKELL